MEGSERGLPPGQRYVRDFIIYAALGIPRINLDDWRLRITGLVKRELALSYEDLESKAPKMRIVRDFHCVTRWSIKDVEWEGVPISWLAELAEVSSEARWVMFYCADGYSTPVPLEDALAEDAIIAIKINGKPLSVEQGFPARPFIPNLYGWKSAKWLEEVSFIAHYVDGYWEMDLHGGYHERGNVWLEERFKGHSGRHTRRRPIKMTR